MLPVIQKPHCLVWTVKRLANTEQWIATCITCIYKKVVGYVFSELVAGVRVFLCLKVNVSVFFVCPILYPQFKKAQEIFEMKRKELTMQAEIQGGRAALRNLGSSSTSWMKRPSNNRRFFTHRYVSNYPSWWLRRVVIRVKVGDDGSGLWVYPLHGDL